MSISSPRWSADGSSLYYYHLSETGAGFRRVSSDGGPSEEIAPGWTMQTHPFAALHPDGRSVLASEFLPDRPPRFLLLDIETGEEHEFPVSIFRP